VIVAVGSQSFNEESDKLASEMIWLCVAKRWLLAASSKSKCGSYSSAHEEKQGAIYLQAFAILSFLPPIIQISCTNTKGMQLIICCCCYHFCDFWSVGACDNKL
jgi:hypothetical protein